MIKLSNLFESQTSFHSINITFPKEEYKLLQERLDKFGVISTTRVGKQFGRFKRNDMCLSPWGDLLKVINVQEFKDINKHPYYKDLTQEQIKLISKYNKYEILTLKKI